MKNLLFFLIIAVVFSACTKDKIEALPPITQEGANTFGCVINGKIYLPKGFEQNKPNFQMIVDPTFNGNLNIRTFRKENGVTQSFGFTCYSVIGTGAFELPGDIYPLYAKDLNSNDCYFVTSNNNFRSGIVNISRYDLANGIISGTFEFKLYDDQISCDTIFITQGRFDKKL